jgi:endonuclease III
VKSPRETREILDKLESQHPGADTELHFQTAFELLAATILSAQSTDALVNTVTPALFKRYPDARALAKATAAELEPQIHSTGFFRAKSKSLIGMAQALVEHHDGEVPATMEALVELPGVGRKTANVVLGHALGIPGLPVDRHVLRVANRIGIAESDDPIVVEQQLCDALPPERWTRTSDTLILHGRRICRPKPLCDQCFVRDECDYYRLVVSRERDPRAIGRSAVARKPPAPSRARAGAAKRPAAGAASRARSTPKPQPTAGGRTRGPAPAKKRKASGAKRVRKARR